MSDKPASRDIGYRPDIRYVVLDTSAIHKDYRLANSETLFLLGHAATQEFRVCVPEIVVREMVNHYREDAVTANVSLDRALRALHNLLNRPVGQALTGEEMESAVQAFDAGFRESLLVHGAHIEPLPPALAGAEALIQRDLKRLKPFADRRGAPRDRSGMRDALLWETALALSQREARSLVLISANSTDFGNAAGDQLHEHLLADLAGIGIGRGIVGYFRSIREFNDRYLSHLRSAAPSRPDPESSEPDTFVSTEHGTEQPDVSAG
jgi:hypothetical protein